MKQIQKIVNNLNKLLAADRNLVELFVDYRITVTDEYTKLGNFVYMQESDTDAPAAGLVGILNGLLEFDKQRIAANYDDDMKLLEFIVLDVNKSS